MEVAAIPRPREIVDIPLARKFATRHTGSYAWLKPKRTRYFHCEREPEYDPYAKCQRDIDRQGTSARRAQDPYERDPYRGCRTTSDRYQRLLGYRSLAVVFEIGGWSLNFI